MIIKRRHSKPGDTRVVRRFAILKWVDDKLLFFHGYRVMQLCIEQGYKFGTKRAIVKKWIDISNNIRP